MAPSGVELELCSTSPAQDASPGPGAESAADLADLLRRAQGGDRAAMDGIVRSFETRILRLSHQMLGNRADAEDVAQEAFLRMFRSLARIEAGKNPGAWLVRVTVHLCWDHLARRHSRSETPLPLEETVSTLPTPSAAAQQGQQREILRRSLLLLAPRERAVFILHEVEGEEVADVARTLRISRVTVRRHLMRARLRLREHLRAHHPQLL
jgi:RNA polymerase sigma-70 factor (ECF subfamily)